MPAVRYQGGFTIIEIFVAIAIVGILISIAIPAFSQMMSDQRIKSVASDLVGELAYARVEAVKRSTRVGLARTGANWEEGWVVFADTNRNGRKDAGEEILKVQEALPNQFKLCAVGASADVMTFGGDGRVRGFDTGNLKAGLTALKVSSSKASPGRRAREVVFGPAGRASVNSGSAIAECP